jgi:pyrroloquinoline-quinone synthase
MQDFLSRLDAAIAEYSLLKHPFYQAWNAGTLTRETLQTYAGQYYQFEKLFPTFVSAAHSNAENAEHRRQLLLNLAEEEGLMGGTSVNHPELWLRFAEATGADRDWTKTAECFPETAGLIGTLRDLTRNGTTLEAVAGLYGYESQIPEISTKKIEGLQSFYGVTSDEGLSFFRVHEEADQIHRQAERDLLQDLIKNEADEKRAIDAARSVAKAFYRMLDGIVRECDVECEMA